MSGAPRTSGRVPAGDTAAPRRTARLPLVQDYGPAAYGEAFADVYDEWYEDISDVTATVAAVRALAGDGDVLELGVGTGRIALPLAATGVPTWGIDASAPMVHRLRVKAGGGRIRVVLADMAAPALAADGRFAVVFCAYNTFFNLDTPDAQAACLAWVARALAPGGRLAIEAFVPTDAHEAPGGSVTVRSVEPDRVVLSVAARDTGAQTITGQFVDISKAGIRLRPYRIRYLLPDQLDAAAAAAGLDLVDRWSDWTGSSFTADSPDHVSVYAA